MQESISGTEDAGRREGQDERSAAIFQRVADQHRRNRRQTEKSEGIHGGGYIRLLQGLRQHNWLRQVARADFSRAPFATRVVQRTMKDGIGIGFRFVTHCCTLHYCGFLVVYQSEGAHRVQWPKGPSLRGKYQTSIRGGVPLELRRVSPI